MSREQILQKFLDQDVIKFSKGYKEFEEVYEYLKYKFQLKREEVKHAGWTEVIITKVKTIDFFISRIEDVIRAYDDDSDLIKDLKYEVENVKEIL